MNDGGPAFPTDWKDFQPTTGEQVVREQFPGMSLRDYFAAKAMVDVLHGFNWEKQNIQKAASLSYEIADAMLAERDKPETRQGGYGG